MRKKKGKKGVKFKKNKGLHFKSIERNNYSDSEVQQDQMESYMKFEDLENGRPNSASKWDNIA